jgi:hypothetical protein
MQRDFSLGIRFVLSGNFGLLCKSYLIRHFFRDVIPQKGVFEFLNQFTHFNHQVKFFIFPQSTPRLFRSFFSNLGTLDLRLEGCRTPIINILFSKFIWKIKTGRFKTNLTLNLILQFNLRLGGYSIWSASFIASHIKEDLTTTHGMSTSQPRCSQESTRKTPSRRSSEELEDTFRSTWKPAVLNYEELGGLSDRWDCTHGVHIVG